MSSKFYLQASDVYNIIEAGAKHGVVKLKFGDLEIEFSRQTGPQGIQPHPGIVHTSLTPDAAMSDKDHEKQTSQALENDELSLREERLALMQIENPSLAEELIRDGELEDDDESDEYTDDE